MSPRRRIQPGEKPLLTKQVSEPPLWSRLRLRRILPRERWQPSRRRIPSLTIAASAVLAAGSLATSSYFAAEGYSDHNDTMESVDLLDFVRSFMTGFTSVDPFHANAYVDHILAFATGDFAKQYHDKQNEILIKIAQAEPTKGNVLAVGVERRYKDDSFDVMVATDVTFKAPDKKQTLDNTNRWVVTAQREGNQWKISNLQQVI